MTANPASDPIPRPFAVPRLGKPGCWSDVVAAIESDGGPITPHPDPETLRLRREHHPKPHAVPTAETSGYTETPLDLDEDPPTPIPARAYDELRDIVIAEVLTPRRGWLRNALRRFA